MTVFQIYFSISIYLMFSQVLSLNQEFTLMAEEKEVTFPKWHIHCHWPT